MFEQAFKNIDDVFGKEADCTTELDYTEQTSWPSNASPATRSAAHFAHNTVVLCRCVSGVLLGERSICDGVDL